MRENNKKYWNKPDSPGSLSERIAKFEAKTTAKKQKHKSRQLPTAGMALAGRVATELVAGIAVGAFAGWLLDRWLGTKPAFMLVLFFFRSCWRFDEYLATSKWKGNVRRIFQRPQRKQRFSSYKKKCRS